MTIPKDMMLAMLESYPDFMGETIEDMPETYQEFIDMQRDRGDSLRVFLITEIFEGARDEEERITPEAVERVMDMALNDVYQFKEGVLHYLQERINRGKELPS